MLRRFSLVECVSVLHGTGVYKASNFYYSSIRTAMFVKKSLVHILYHKELADARILRRVSALMQDVHQSSPQFQWGSCCLICVVFCISLFALLYMVFCTLSVILQCAAFNYPFGFFKFVLHIYTFEKKQNFETIFEQLHFVYMYTICKVHYYCFL